MRIPSLAGNLALFLGAVLAVNGLIFGLGFRGSPADGGGPPGWLVGGVWTALFLLLGVAHWLLQREGAGWSRGRSGVLAFALLCLAYPFYTGGLADLRAGLAGNVATAAAALVLAWRLRPLSPAASALVLPVVPWLAYASWTIVRGPGA